MTKQIFNQTWWDNNLNNPSKFNEYLGWLGNETSDSRVFIRDNIKKLGIRSVADFGCGPCLEYIALKNDNYKIKYLGIDSCVHLKEFNESKGIPFLNLPIEKTNLEDSCFELSYSRHVLEHLPTYEDALKEMIRVASDYVVHIFFIKPSDSWEINYWKEENLYHNCYSKDDIEEYLKLNKKVNFYEWVDINDDENALVINLKK